MDATSILTHEHRIIERMLGVLSNYSAKIEQGKKVDPTRLRDCVDFIRTFADTCHHAKEEGVLFSEMETHNMPRNGGPVGVMLAEHEMGRNFVKGMASAIDGYERGDAGAGREFVKNARGYTSLLSQHINKEDTILYPMAEDMLSGMDHELVERFEGVEKKLGTNVHERYERMVEQLEKDSRA